MIGEIDLNIMFCLNSETQFCEWWLVGLDVQNTVIWPSHYMWPLWHPVLFLNLEIWFGEWWLVGLDVQNTVIWPSHYVWPLWHPVLFLNLEIWFGEWWLAGLDVQNTVTCHSWPSSYLWPRRLCSSGDVNVHISRLTSKRLWRHATGELCIQSC